MVKKKRAANRARLRPSAPFAGLDALSPGKFVIRRLKVGMLIAPS